MPLVLESITDVVYSRLSALESTTYEGVTFNDVQYSLAEPDQIFSPGHGRVLLTLGDCVRMPDRDIPGNPPGIGWQQIFNIRVYTRDEDSSVNWQILTTRYIAGIVKGLTTANNWQTMGGFAIDSEFLGWSHEPPDGGLGGATLPLAVTYRVSEFDMAVQR